MRVVTPIDLRRSLGAILDAASAGERFVIERDRRPLAMLVSVEDGRRLEADAEDGRSRRLAALARLEALGSRVTPRRPVAPRARSASPGLPHGAESGSGGPAAPTLAVSDTLQPAPVAERRPPEDRDRHSIERQRHAGEGLVGLG